MKSTTTAPKTTTTAIKSTTAVSGTSLSTTMEVTYPPDHCHSCSAEGMKYYIEHLNSWKYCH